MNTLADAFRLARAGHADVRLREALIAFVFSIIVGWGTIAAIVVHSTVGYVSVTGLALWGTLLLAECWIVATAYRAALAAADRIVREKGICPRCLYPRVPQSPTCPECGLEHPRLRVVEDEEWSKRS